MVSQVRRSCWEPVPPSDWLPSLTLPLATGELSTPEVSTGLATFSFAASPLQAWRTVVSNLCQVVSNFCLYSMPFPRMRKVPPAIAPSVKSSRTTMTGARRFLPVSVYSPNGTRTNGSSLRTRTGYCCRGVSGTLLLVGGGGGEVHEARLVRGAENAAEATSPANSSSRWTSVLAGAYSQEPSRCCPLSGGCPRYRH